MAMRRKTVEYPIGFHSGSLNTATSLASADRHEFSAVTLYLPETTSRTFTSATIYLYSMDQGASATSNHGYRVGIKLGSASFSDTDRTITLANSAEHQGHLVQEDVTSYFNTNFGTGTSQTCQVAVAKQTGSATTHSNVSCKLILTYEYDDASHDTRVKTVRIPLESITGALTTTLAELGTDQVPALDSFLPEASKTYRAVWFEVEANEYQSGTNGSALGLALDAESEAADATHQQALNSSRFYWRVWVRNDMTTNATHAFKARSSHANAVYRHMAVVLYVTYEYDHASSTRILNSLRLCGFSEAGAAGGTGAPSAYVTRFHVPEPGTITLLQSGVQMFWTVRATSATNVAVKVGDQTVRTYDAASMGAVCGGFSLAHRIDSGAAQGAYGTLARGFNAMEVRIASPGSSDEWGGSFGGILYLNYTSDKATGGDGTHNHSVMDHLHPGWVIVNYRRIPNSVDHEFPETSYYISSYYAEVVDHSDGTGRSSHAVALRLQSGDYIEQGYNEEGSTAVNAGFGEIGMFKSILPLGGARLKQYSTDPRTDRIVVRNAAREYKISTTSARLASAVIWLTYHSCTFAVSGTVSGYTSGDGSGITVNLHRADTHQIVATTTTAAGGTYSFDWLDDTVQVYVTARKSATELGMSDVDYAG